MVELSDIHVGLALGAGGVLALTGWVWQDAAGRRIRLVPLWAAGVLFTAGLGFLPYFLTTRRRQGAALTRGMAAWLVWMSVVAAGSTAAVVLASRNREAGEIGASSTAGSQATQTPNPAWGDFDRAFPDTPPHPGSAPSP